jgi:prolyl 4-hydroxylase
MHVDTATTHAVSAIINVEQDIDEDWPLLILDHELNEHNVSMKAGDMVVYESAKALHGRPTAMRGRHYDNVFVHFQPLNGWNYDWL